MVQFRQFFEKNSSSYSYLLWDTLSREAIYIDPVDVTHERDMTILRELGLSLKYIVDTHVHADHATGASLLKEKTGASILISALSGAQMADRYLGDGEEIVLGNIHLRVVATPGHTSGCTSYYEKNKGIVFTGDALLIRGCGRTDFQGGDATKLYESIGKLYSLPDTTILAPGHDYLGRSLSTIGEEKIYNARCTVNTSLEEFVLTMNSLRLEKPARIEEVVPINLRLGVRT